jgi:hypothetical protein
MSSADVKPYQAEGFYFEFSPTAAPTSARSGRPTRTSAGPTRRS